MILHYIVSPVMIPCCELYIAGALILSYVMYRYIILFHGVEKCRKSEKKQGSRGFGTSNMS